MNTLPIPSTASPVNAPSPATKTRWSSAWPGTCSATSGPNAPPSAATPLAPGQRIAATGGPPSASRIASAPSAWSGWSWVSAIPPAPPRAATAAATASTCAGIAGPGVDDPGRVAPHDPGVRAVERVGRRVRRADERDVHARAYFERDAVDRPVERGDVDAAAGVLAERREARDLQRRRLDAARPAALEPRPEDPALAEVAEHVAAVERDAAVADDDAARDRAVPVRVRLHDHRLHVAGRALARRVARAALERPPAEVRALAACRARTKSISSHSSWPTSPMASAPVLRSKEKRHGLRRP